MLESDSSSTRDNHSELLCALAGVSGVGGSSTRESQSEADDSPVSIEEVSGVGGSSTRESQSEADDSPVAIERTSVGDSSSTRDNHSELPRSVATAVGDSSSMRDNHSELPKSVVAVGTIGSTRDNHCVESASWIVAADVVADAPQLARSDDTSPPTDRSPPTISIWACWKFASAIGASSNTPPGWRIRAARVALAIAAIPGKL